MDNFDPYNVFLSIATNIFHIYTVAKAVYLNSKTSVCL